MFHCWSIIDFVLTIKKSLKSQWTHPGVVVLPVSDCCYAVINFTVSLCFMKFSSLRRCSRLNHKHRNSTCTDRTLLQRTHWADLGRVLSLVLDYQTCPHCAAERSDCSQSAAEEKTHRLFVFLQTNHSHLQEGGKIITWKENTTKIFIRTSHFQCDDCILLVVCRDVDSENEQTGSRREENVPSSNEGLYSRLRLRDMTK